MKKIYDMTQAERKEYFTELGRKGGIASKKKGANYSKLAKKRWNKAVK